MKQLTKEELAKYVTNTMVEIYKVNAEEMYERIENSSENLGSLLGRCMFESIMFSSMVLVDTLDHVLNNE